MSASPLWRRYDRLLGPDPTADVKDELRFHLEAHIDDLIAQGMTPEAARREAERQFGDIRALQKISVDIKEKMERHKRFEDYLRDCLQDARYAVRTLLRDPGFAAVSIVILALAIGANIAVFSVVNTLLLRPLPFPDSREIVWIAPPGDLALSDSTYSSDAYEEFRDQSRAYRAVTGYFAFSGPDNDKLTSLPVPEPVTSISVIGNFFQVLGVKPALGRLFTMDDARTGASPVVLLANAWWRRQFNGDPGIVGKTIDIDGRPARVMGVLPESFDFGAVFSPGTKVDFITPFNLEQGRTWGNIVTLIGRLKPGVTAEQASDDARRIIPNLYQNVKIPATRGQYKDMGAIPLRDHVTGKLHRSLTALWCAVGLILLIAGVNLSNLLLARGAARSKEFAVRGALGASRGRTAMQLLIESLVLCGAGTVLGLGLATVLIAWIAHQESVALPLLSTLRIDGVTLGWTVLLAGFTTVLFGLVPRVREADGNLQEGLKDSGPGAGLGRGDERVRSTLVVSEIALACVLLVSAGLFLRSFLRVLDVDLGFEADHAASITVDYDDSAPTNDASAAKRAFLFQRVLSRIAALPGVKNAGIADYLPFGTNRQWGVPTPEGKAFAPGQLPDPLVYVVTPGFIHAMGIGLRGRDFSWTDTMHSQQVVLINASAARLYWPGEDAVGKVLTNGTPPLLHVIGVVNDVHEENVEGPAGAQIYYPVTQQNPNGAQLVIRTSLAPSALAGSVMRVLRELNPGQPAAEFRPIRTIVERARSPRRFFTLLVGAFAGLGLLLAALGIYGVISYSVARKTQEIGVRMAIGASAGQIRREILLKTLRLVVAGIALGTVASLVSARLIASLLFATSPWDATAYGAMVLLLIAVALVSGYLPARRASGIEPLSALRIQ